MPAPILKVSTTNQFATISAFALANGLFATFYRPKPQNGYYAIGDVSSIGGGPPVVTLAVENDDSAAPLLKNPIGYTRAAVVGIVPVLPIFPPKILVAFQPIAPDGYVPLGQATAIWVPTNAQARRLGAIGQGDPYTFVHGLSSELIGGLADPPLDALVCLRFDYAAQGAFGPLIWMGRTIPPAAGYLVAKTNVTYTQLGEVPPVGPIYIPKSIVLDNK